MKIVVAIHPNEDHGREAFEPYLMPTSLCEPVV